MVNSPGTVDAAYRGELQIILINHDPHNSVSFKRGDRIAQLVIQKVEQAEFIEVSHLPGSDRGSGGFGSTGVTG
jgi:dUTP pyrophosphatase